MTDDVKAALAGPRVELRLLDGDKLLCTVTKPIPSETLWTLMDPDVGHLLRTCQLDGCVEDLPDALAKLIEDRHRQLFETVKN